jgi:hypothetical protein
MRVRVSDESRLQSLIRYLREAGCIAEQASADTLDVFMPSVPKQRDARMELGVYLTAWRIRNPGVETELLTPPPRPLR